MHIFRLVLSCVFAIIFLFLASYHRQPSVLFAQIDTTRQVGFHVLIPILSDNKIPTEDAGHPNIHYTHFSKIVSAGRVFKIVDQSGNIVNKGPDIGKLTTLSDTDCFYWILGHVGDDAVWIFVGSPKQFSQAKVGWQRVGSHIFFW